MRNYFASVDGKILFSGMIIGFVVFLFSDQALSSSVGQKNKGETVYFSLLANQQPLYKVIEEISEKTNYSISFPESHKNVAITIKLTDVGLRDGLERILKKYNKTLVIDDSEKQIVIRIFSKDLKEYGDSIPAAVYSPEQPKSGPEGINNNIDQAEFSFEGRGINRRELEELKSSQVPSDPMEDEVVPGMTRGELQRIKDQQVNSDPLDDEVVPPETPGGKGITRRKLSEIQGNMNMGDPLDDEVVPPDIF